MASRAICVIVLGVVPVDPATPALSNVTTRRLCASASTSAGSQLSPRAFGHTGFTGTSLWLDPDRDLFIILLKNRVNPTRANNAIRRVRHHVADLVADALTDPEL